MSDSAVNAPSPPVSPPAPAPMHGATAPGRRRRTLFLGMGAVVVVLVASVSLWYVVRGSADGTGCPTARPQVPANAAPAFTFRMPECFKLADAEIVADLTKPPAVQQQLAAIVPLTGGDADNMIIVRASDVFRDTSAESDAEIEDRLRAADERAGLAIDTYKRRTIDGARGWGGVDTTSSGGHSEAWVFYKGSRRVNLSCWWNQATTKDRILAGCAQVLDTLTIA